MSSKCELTIRSITGQLTISTNKIEIIYAHNFFVVVSSLSLSNESGNRARVIYHIDFCVFVIFQYCIPWELIFFKSVYHELSRQTHIQQ